MASTCATGTLRRIRHAYMGVPRSGSAPDVHGPDGMRGSQFYLEAMDQRRTT